MEMLLEARNLGKTYETFSLENINLTIPAGGMVGLIGENGAGKTTLLKSLLNVTRRSSGEVFLFGSPLEEKERQAKDQLGVVFEDCTFHESLNALQVGKIMSKVYSQWDQIQYISLLSRMKLPEKMRVKSILEA